MVDFVVKRGDRKESLTMTLRDSSGQVANLSGLTTANILFKMRKFESDVLKVNAPVTAIEAPPTDGRVTYAWADGDTDDPGFYDAEVEVTFPADGNKKQTFPSNGYMQVYVSADLA